MNNIKFINVINCFRRSPEKFWEMVECKFDCKENNTLSIIKYAFHTCVFYPKTAILLTGVYDRNTAKIIEEKYCELVDFYPLIKNEIFCAKFSKDKAEIEFRNGSKIIGCQNKGEYNI